MEKNQNQDGQRAEHKILFILITIITLLLAIYGKFLTIGWLTVLLIWCQLITVHFILFTIAGIRLAKIKNKQRSDYISFFILCITLLLYTYTFVDAGDIGSSKVIDFIDENILVYISFGSFVTNIILSLSTISRH